MTIGHPLASTPQLTQNDLLPKLKATTTGQVLIVAAPPGSGKSTAMYAAVAAQAAEQERSSPNVPYRVVWATQGIHGDASLGREAKEELEKSLRDVGLTKGVKVLRGQRHFVHPWQYHAQFKWPSDIAVHVVSHAHLPLLLADVPGGRFERFMRDVQVVIVDEDPLGAFIYSLGTKCEGVTPVWLQWHDPATPPGSVGEALGIVMQRALDGAIPSAHIEKTEQRVLQRVEYNLRGPHFWTYFLDALGKQVPDWEAFRATLSAAICKQNQYAVVPDEVVDEMRAEYGQALLGPQNSLRFGLTWDDEFPSTSIRFRADVLRVIPAQTPPIVVLDAYADPAVGQYQAMFPHHRVKFETEWQSVPLDVEFISELMVDRNNLLNSEPKRQQQKRRNNMMAEVGQLAATHDVGALVLSYKKVTSFLAQEEFARHWATRPGVTLPLLNLKGEKSVEFAHWFAGRGVNTYWGRHVIALHAPERPSVVEHHQMAALAPRSSRRRRQLAQHLRRTELLQMLHRGRQTNFAVGGPQRPRVIVAFDLQEFDEQLGSSSWMTVRQSSPQRPFRVSSENPHHPHAVQELSLELLQLCGAVPHLCLVVLGLYTARPVEEKTVQLARSALKRQTRHVKREAPLLHHWDGPLQPLYDAVGVYEAATGQQTNRTLAIFRDRNGLANLEPFYVRLPERFGGAKTRVYASGPASAEEAIKTLFGSC